MNLRDNLGDHKSISTGKDVAQSLAQAALRMSVQLS